MNDEKAYRETWLRRFMARGGLNLSLTLLAAPFICYLLRRWLDLSWFYAVLVGIVVSLLVAHIFLLPIVLLALRFLAPATFSEVCPVCGERALSLGMCISQPTDDPELHRVYQLAHCRRCQRHFHRLSNGTYDEQPTPDSA